MCIRDRRTTQRTPFGMVQSQGPCPKCGGTGKIIHQPCPTCKGKANVRKMCIRDRDKPGLSRIQRGPGLARAAEQQKVRSLLPGLAQHDRRYRLCKRLLRRSSRDGREV